ncbi:UDP-glucose 4-epimerase GalE [Bacillota bacterium Meth-B3]|nr:UDP-glucose 4-epimerase GalE [Christensenellaceae bacterium]MEA5069380.1 UDP-glucose 4-epimerase GalE [Christensenellaceae bacterium]
MKVLLTGGAGYIGSHTGLALLNAGHDIVVADNYANSSPEALGRVRALSGRDFPAYEVDVCDRAAVDAVFQAHTFDAVIHFAGLKAVGESVSQPIEYYRNNIDSTLSLVEAMREHGVYRMVFSSSATVYGATKASEMTEDLPTGCTNPYGWTKYMNEQILRDVCVSDDRWSVALLRYFNPVGAHESGQIGEDPNGIPNNLMPRVMQHAQGKIPVLGVFGDDYPTADGTCIRDYIHVLDLAKGHVAALEYVRAHKGAEAINLGTGIGYSVYDILRTFEAVNGVKLRYEVQPRRPGDAPISYANPQKAERLLHWKAEKTLSDMCRDAWRWQIDNPNGY